MPDALALLKTRRSVNLGDLIDPGPSAAEIETILTIATRVPDHGKLAPWRFIVFEGDARLQAGQLDAASAYLSQAIQLHLHYITLPATINLGDFTMKDQYAKASLTITGGVVKTGKPIVLNVTVIGKNDQAAADAFVAYLLSPTGRRLYAQGGYTLLTPTAFGTMSAIPASVRKELG